MKAFTLIELLVVVAIIGILAAVGVTTFNGFQEKAKVSVAKQNYSIIKKKVTLVATLCGMQDSVELKKNWQDKTVFDVPCYDGNIMNFFQVLPKQTMVGILEPKIGRIFTSPRNNFFLTFCTNGYKWLLVQSVC